MFLDVITTPNYELLLRESFENGDTKHNLYLLANSRSDYCGPIRRYHPAGVETDRGS